MDKKVFLFWDNSNIFIGAQSHGVKAEKGTDSRAIRIKFDNLYKLGTAARNVEKAIAVGSMPPELMDVWNEMQRTTGIKPELYERGHFTNTEQGLDQCLQVHMLRALSDFENNPQIAVVLTGDGAGYGKGTGFYADLERMHKKGWGVEVLSWEIACHKGLMDWAQRAGSFIRLEDYYDSITFVQDGRFAKPLNLTRRPKSHPRAFEDKEKERLLKKAERLEGELKKETERRKQAEAHARNLKTGKRK